MNMDFTTLIIFLPMIIISVIIHEVSHGYAALMLGDKTAKNLGRLSLNPIKHADVFGSLILPLISMFVFGWPVGYAKPVPINPSYFKNQRNGMTLTAAAGPLSNFALAVVASLFLKIVSSTSGAVVIESFIMINLALGIFNLLPVPPLDGSKVLAGFMPRAWLSSYYHYERYGIVLIFIIIFLFPKVLGAILSFIMDPLLILLGVKYFS